MGCTITCVCVTHGRPYFLNEAVESFLRQERDGFTAELLIYSDCPEQELVCDLPDVRVVNLDEPIPDLSLKFNRAVESARGEFVAWWEDDDISLPFRLRHSVRMMESHGSSYCKQGSAWFWNDGRITDFSSNLFFGNSFFRRDSYLRAGGAVEGMPADLSVHRALISSCGCQVENNLPSETYFLYRWAGMGHHDSGVTGSNSERFRKFRESTLADPRFVHGRVTIEPSWSQDYHVLAIEAAKMFAED
jgi:hypothetical protein